jgi:quinol monooxygenase YgiN
MPIGVLVTMTAKPGGADELSGHLRQAVADSRTEAGNLMCVLLADPADADRFHIFEIYRDEAAMQAHREEPHTIKSTPIIHALFGAPVEIRRFPTLDWPATLSVVYD